MPIRVPDRGKYGAPERIRTPNLLIRSQVLCPVELRALAVSQPSTGRLRTLLNAIRLGKAVKDVMHSIPMV
jgi:hypothetical protein